MGLIMGIAGLYCLIGLVLMTNKSIYKDRLILNDWVGRVVVVPCAMYVFCWPRFIGYTQDD